MMAKSQNNFKSKTEGVTIVEEAIKLTSINPVSSELFFDDLLLSVPLMMKDGTDLIFPYCDFSKYGCRFPAETP